MKITLRYWTVFYASPYAYGKLCRSVAANGVQLNWAQQLYAAYHRSAVERRIRQGKSS